MCGIVAEVNTANPVNHEVFQSKVDALMHRGPDDAGCWFSNDGRVAIGNRRLAIQDLSPAGHMPMGDASGKVWITFNGEIYNFQDLRKELEQRGHGFRGGSDTEVLLEAYLEWGTECLARVDGMFAFGLFDGRHVSSQGRLFFARDRAGEKPLYYRHHRTGIQCASELKALMADPEMSRRLDLRSLNMFLGLGYVPGNMSILQGIKKLPPACAAVYDLDKNTLNIWRYWSLPDASPSDDADTELSVDELKNYLFDSTRRCLVADVPAGVILSGGIDSSLVTAAASNVSPNRLKTFTISFPGHGHYDEGAYARQVAEWFGTEHYELAVEENFVDLLPQLAIQFDEPLADSSLVPTYIISRLIRRHVTVALAGDGGDELFGGYPTYDRHQRDRRLFAMPRLVRELMAGFAKNFMPLGMRGRQYISTIDGGLRENFVSYTLLFDAHMRQRLLHPDVWQILSEKIEEPEGYRLGLWCLDCKDPVDQMSRLDFLTYLPDDILTKVDRASMAVSLEVRAPWLARQIIEYAFGKIPARLKVNQGKRKIFLNKLARRLLPPDLDLTRKQGFSLPLVDWSKGAWTSTSRDVLRDCDNQVFNLKAVSRLLDGPKFGLSVSGYLFALVMFELWRQHYRVSLP